MGQKKTGPQGNRASALSDDLTRIKGIGVVMELKLKGLGVRRYSDIAAWGNLHIARFSKTLDFKGRIERENWVEQALILAAGGTTDFARRVDRKDIETGKSKPTP